MRLDEEKSDGRARQFLEEGMTFRGYEIIAAAMIFLILVISIFGLTSSLKGLQNDHNLLVERFNKECVISPNGASPSLLVPLFPVNDTTKKGVLDGEKNE